MLVGLISDTHGVFGPEFRDFLEPVDVLWHAGDFGTLEVAEAMDLAFRQADQAASSSLTEEQCTQLCAMLADVCDTLNQERKSPT